MFDRWKRYIPIGIILLYSLFLFRSYIFKGHVPFPANLLVATFEPWKSYPVPEYPNGPPNKPMGFDNLRIYYPLKSVAIDLMKHMQPPLWNPYNFTGNTILATYQSAIFHPLSFLFLLIPQIDAWSITIFLQPIAAGLAIYVFLSVLEFSLSARLFGALALAFSGFFIVWWEEAYMFTYSALFLPLALASFEQYIKHNKRYWLITLSLCLAGSILSGAFQMTFYVFLYTACWIVYRLWSHPKKWVFLGYIFLTYTFSILLSSAHLIPSIEAYYYSSRIAIDAKYIFESSLLPLYQLVTLIAPDYFGNPGTYNYFGFGFYHERMVWFGLVPLFFVLMQCIQPSQKKYSKFFLISFFLTLTLVLDLPSTWFLLYSLKIPILSNLTPSRIAMLVAFSAAMLTAYGVETHWHGLRKRTILFPFFIIGTAFLIALLYPFYYRSLHPKYVINIVSLRNLVIPFISFIIISLSLFVGRQKKFRSIGYGIIVVIFLGNSFVFAHKFLYFSERRFIYPNTPVLSKLQSIAKTDRFWTYENGYIEKNFATQYHLFSPEGYDSITIKRYAEFIAYVNSHGKNMTPARSDALIPSTDHINTILTDPFRRKALELLNVRYIVRRLTPDRGDQSIMTSVPELPTIWSDNTYAIHELQTVLPHAALFHTIHIIPDGRTELDTMFHDKTNLHSSLFLEQQHPGIPLNPEATGTATIVHYQPNSVTVETTTTDDMMLFLSDAYFPGWNTYVDGRQIPLYRANYAFRATVAPKGTHTIVFKYEPISWMLGLIGSSVGILLSLVYLVRKHHS